MSSAKIQHVSVQLPLTIQEADTILRRHLNTSCVDLKYVESGWNNHPYIVTDNTGSEYVIRLCGRHWTRWKTEREVPTLCFIRLKCDEDPELHIPAPRVYGFCSNKEESGIGYEYILMERVPGVCLESIWDSKLSISEKERIFDQIADIVRSLQSITFDKIGHLRFVPAIGDTFGVGVNPCTDISLADIYVGHQSDIMCGPFENYIDYQKVAILKAVETMKQTPYMSSNLDLVPRIEEFVQAQVRSGSQFFHNESMTRPKITLGHGDLGAHNIMIDPTSLQIAVVDWEWAGAYPYYEDYLFGFESFGANCDPAWTFGEPPTNPDEYDPHTEEMTTNRDLLFTALAAHNVDRPDEVPWLHFHAELWHLRWSISPWWLCEAIDLDASIPAKAHWDREREYGRKCIEKVLNKYSKV